VLLVRLVSAAGDGVSTGPTRIASTANPNAGFEMQRITKSAGVLLCTFALWGCRPADSEPSQANVRLDFDPSPPVVGDAGVRLTLSDAAGKPLYGGKVVLEGNMNHAGMKPSFAELREVEPGRHVGTLKFTMGGDWFIIVTANMPDGSRIERKVEVQGVRVP